MLCMLSKKHKRSDGSFKDDEQELIKLKLEVDRVGGRIRSLKVQVLLSDEQDTSELFFS